MIAGQEHEAAELRMKRICHCIGIYSGVTLLSLLVACGDARDPGPAPDLIVTNADVRTVDLAMGRAEAFAVRDGKFLAVGSTAEITALADDSTAIIDAGGVTVIPGLVDGHTHLISGADLAVGVDLTDIEDKDEWQRIIRQKAEELPDGDWILGGAWNHNLSDGILPDKEMLDAVAPNHPVWLRDIDGHTGWANSLAIELAGVTADTVVPPGGEILIDEATGEPTGIFLETAGYVFRDAPGMAEATNPVTGIKSAVRMANSLGITSAHDMSADFDAFLEVLDDGDLSVRIWQGARPRRPVDATAETILAETAAERDRVRQRVATNGLGETKGPLFEIGYIKLMIDGVLSTRTAMMKEPYADDRDVEVEPFSSKAELFSMIAAAHDHGFPVAIHAIGDKGVAWVIDGFAEHPPAAGSLPDRVEHIEVVTPDDVDRFATLGVAASMQPHHATCCVGDYVIDRIGRARMPNAYVWRSMLDSNVPLVLGSDWPTSPLNPMVQVADTLHRETRIDGVERPWDEGMSLSFDEALLGYTQAGADMTAWANEIGSITAGKWADFVILDQRLPDAVDRDIENRTVTATYLAGQQVYP
jgi:predicted amidohydrolase YtcJ